MLDLDRLRQLGVGELRALVAQRQLRVDSDGVVLRILYIGGKLKLLRFHLGVNL